MGTWIQKLIHFLERWTPAPEISIDPDGLEDEQPAIVDDFANCSVRDILYCQMPVSAQDRLRIKPGHDVRPYLVMKKGENGFWGYPMTTSHQRYAYDEKLMYNLRETGQSEIKSSCFLFVPSVYVPAENVFYPWGRLDPRWEGAIERRIACQKSRHMYCSYHSFGLPVPIKESDVVFLKDGRIGFVESLHNNKAKVRLLREHSRGSLSCPVSIPPQTWWMDLASYAFLAVQDLALYAILPKKDIDAIRGYLKPETAPAPAAKPKPKKRYPIDPSRIFYQYPPGTVLELGYKEKQFVYFFSTQSAAYVFPDELHDMGRFNLVEINPEHYRPVASVSDDEMLESCAKLQNDNLPYGAAVRKVKADYLASYATKNQSDLH